jgi:hypothetical protein
MTAERIADLLLARRAGPGRWVAKYPAHADRSERYSTREFSFLRGKHDQFSQSAVPRLAGEIKMGSKRRSPARDQASQAMEIQNWVQHDPDGLLSQQLIETLRAYRTALVRRVAEIKALQPPTGNKLRPFCRAILSIDRLRLDNEDLEAAA